MTNFIETQNQQKNTSDSDVFNEASIKPIDILQELEPLINEYFIGDFKIENNALLMNFKNGQTMRLAVGEVI